MAEEDIGLWRYGAEPDAGSERRQLDATAEGGHLAPDVEGVGIFRGKDGAGYLVVSNQGADNYAVYRRQGDNAFIGHFAIVANDELGIDGASETDGLDVTSMAVGQGFPSGSAGGAGRSQPRASRKTELQAGSLGARRGSARVCSAVHSRHDLTLAGSGHVPWQDFIAGACP